MLTPLEVYCHNFYDVFLLVVWWPEEKAKKIMLCLNSEEYPFLWKISM
jgi:hypothetical protein